jgi:hypothetical protein
MTGFAGAAGGADAAGGGLAAATGAAGAFAGAGAGGVAGAGSGGFFSEPLRLKNPNMHSLQRPQPKWL